MNAHVIGNNVYVCPISHGNEDQDKRWKKQKIWPDRRMQNKTTSFTK